VAETIALNFAGGADDIPTFSLADLRACVEKDDKDFFRHHFDGKVVLIGTMLDVEDRKITSKRFAAAAEGARAARCALTTVNNLLRGDALIEFDRIRTGIASFTLAAFAVAAALPAVEQSFARDSISGVYIQATALRSRRKRRRWRAPQPFSGQCCRACSRATLPKASSIFSRT
jgi:hypothetical protein